MGDGGRVWFMLFGMDGRAGRRRGNFQAGPAAVRADHHRKPYTRFPGKFQGKYRGKANTLPALRSVESASR